MLNIEPIYDLIYADKDYNREAEEIHWIISNARPDARTLLDVACGTGKHLFFLQQHYQVEGLDINVAMLEQAKIRLPGVPLHHSDMADFTLPARKFDIITCLFGSIGYVGTYEKLAKAIGSFQQHLADNGAIILEPWIMAQFYEPAMGLTRTVGDIHVTSDNTREGNMAVMKKTYVTPNQTYTTEDRIALFEFEEYKQAFRDNGLNVRYVRCEPFWGLFVGTPD